MDGKISIDFFRKSYTVTSIRGNRKSKSLKIMTSSTYRLSKKLAKRRVLVPIVGALALLLLFLQSAELTHTHNDVAQQIQCEICVKIGASDDIVAVSSVSMSFGVVRQSYLASALESVPYLAPVPAKSRAPPLA